jgi:hypothetical protein
MLNPQITVGSTRGRRPGRREAVSLEAIAPTHHPLEIDAADGADVDPLLVDAS